MSNNWKQTLAAVAPSIATALGGSMAGVAVSVATRALGLTEGDEDGLQAAVASGNPDVLLKLKEAENEFRVQLKRLEVDIHKVDAGDRKDARGMAINTTLIPQAVLATIFVSGFVYVLSILFRGNSVIAAEMMQPAMYVLGILSAGIIQIMNFFFGSSSGSKEKDMMARLPKQ